MYVPVFDSFCIFPTAAVVVVGGILLSWKGELPGELCGHRVSERSLNPSAATAGRPGDLL